MPTEPSPLQRLQQSLGDDITTPIQIATNCLARSNTNAHRNVYLSQDAPALTQRAVAREALPKDLRLPLHSIPISLKDCFDLRGAVTTCGSRFYADHNLEATHDSWVAAQLKQTGALVSGKTHLHQLAYGITGQNHDFGDSLQPADPALLTGGSSSGAAASVQEGSALAAIGTDTGGSIRVPAALCGLAGFRASVDLGARIGIDIWAGATHLAPSFDTLGLLFRDLRDGPALAQAIFSLPATPAPISQPRIATVPAEFTHDCEPEVLAAYAAQKEALLAQGATLHEIDTAFWEDSIEIFAPLQAHEAALIQRQKLAALNQPFPKFEIFEQQIAQRLLWGESLPLPTLGSLRQRHAAFRAAMDQLLTQHDLLLLPCAPIHRLRADADHTHTRTRLLRYTTPLSLSGMPSMTLPHANGIGMQLAAARGRDTALLQYAATLN